MKKVAILDAQTIQAIAVSKCLQELNYYVILLCNSKNSYGYHTKYADRKIIAPSIQNETEAFHSFFVKFLQSEKIDVVIWGGGF